MTIIITGLVLNRQTGRGAAGLRVEAWDREQSILAQPAKTTASIACCWPS
jgi:hypothetical protein